MRSNGMWIAAALLLGIGAGYVAGSQSVAPDEPSETVLEGDVETGPDQPAPELLPATRPEPRPGVPGGSDTPLSSGDGVIRGSVKDKAGNPAHTFIFKPDSNCGGSGVCLVQTGDMLHGMMQRKYACAVLQGCAKCYALESL